jgi:hypothetical protein
MSSITMLEKGLTEQREIPVANKKNKYGHEEPVIK